MAEAAAPAPALARPSPLARTEFRHFMPIQTRWMDNDLYGHVNNVVYYSWFDTAVNRYLIEQGVLDIHAGAVIGLVIETQCNYFAPLAFPEPVEAGLRVAHLGRSSVRYQVGFMPKARRCARPRGTSCTCMWTGPHGARCRCRRICTPCSPVCFKRLSPRRRCGPGRARF